MARLQMVLTHVLRTHTTAQQQGFISTAAWLGYFCGIGATAAREKVRVARALEELPSVDAEFAAGRLSYSKVRALHRRDKGCRFPGCTHARFVDAHHVHHWAHGGSTTDARTASGRRYRGNF